MSAKWILIYWYISPSRTMSRDLLITCLTYYKLPYHERHCWRRHNGAQHALLVTEVSSNALIAPCLTHYVGSACTTLAGNCHFTRSNVGQVPTFSMRLYGKLAFTFLLHTIQRDHFVMA